MRWASPTSTCGGPGARRSSARWRRCRTQRPRHSKRFRAPRSARRAGASAGCGWACCCARWRWPPPSYCIRARAQRSTPGTSACRCSRCRRRTRRKRASIPPIRRCSRIAHCWLHRTNCRWRAGCRCWPGLATDTAALPPADPTIAPATADAPPDATELARRTQAWERLAPAARAQARAAWAEWQALTDAERTQLRAIATRFDALPAADQQALRERYAQQPFDAHRGWHLGPHLGRDWPRIAPLFAFVDTGERAALLQLLRELSGDDLEALARLAQTTPPQARTTLRRALLAEPPARRSA
ncbi:DUF3106 domain-containing protein [Thermomonas sp. S9]|nr:DUF3106 domain-containing protein [Thermomonas sp. S9]